MQQRAFPKIPGFAVSALGLGAMRLPVMGGEHSRIDEEHATRMVHQAIRAGVNYIDTAWPYHGGESERFVGRALQGGWRQKVQLATKCPVWEVEVEADVDRFLDRQLEKLQTERIDFYLLHALDAERWEKMKRLRATAALERARADGRVGHIGFSFHGSLDDFRKIVDEYDWEFTQIQLNYLDQVFQAGLEGMRYAAVRRIGVIVMEPVRGGALAAAPRQVLEILSRAGRPWSPAEWALRWLWHHPEVVTVLSGASTVEQVVENAAAASAPGTLTPEELACLEDVRAFYQARMAVPCTACGYCQPCPNEVAIADVFNSWNSGRMFEDPKTAAWHYRTFQLANGSGADKCLECGDCEPRCPQHISIAEKLQAAHEYLTSA